MSLSLIALAALAAGASGALSRRASGGRSGVVALAVGLVGLVVIVATRRAWEHEVRRPVWLLSAARGHWIDRGVDGLLTADALLVACGLRSFGAETSRRVGVLAMAASLFALCAMAFGVWSR